MSVRANEQTNDFITWSVASGLHSTPKPISYFSVSKYLIIPVCEFENEIRREGEWGGRVIFDANLVGSENSSNHARISDQDIVVLG